LSLAIVVAAGVWMIAHRGDTAINRNPATPGQAVAPIQDGKTLDFSSGKLVVKSDPTLKQAGAELDAAVANVTFAPRGNQTTPPTK
jgi:hypothetical protein